MTTPDAFDFTSPPTADRLILRREVVRQGQTDADIRRALGDKLIERVWWGSYVPTAADDSVDEFVRRTNQYREMVLAAVRTGGPRRYLSHQSAACLLEIPLLAPDLSTVHFTAELSGRSSKTLRIHQSSSTTRDLVSIDGIEVTGIARTVCDVARQGTLRQAVCALDSGLYQARRRSIEVALAPAVAAMDRKHGIATLRQALPLASDLSESIDESLSKVTIYESGPIPMPDAQVEIVLADGSVVRSDFGWRDDDGVLRVVGEFDGRVKYHRQSAASGGRLAEDVIYEEKLREDAIRECGIIVARWTWSDLKTPGVLIRRLSVALQRPGSSDASALPLVSAVLCRASLAHGRE